MKTMLDSGFGKRRVGIRPLSILAACLAAGCAGTGPTTIGTGVAQPQDTGLRAFSAAAYTPGQPVVISVSVVPDNSSVAYALEDAPPPGWTVSNINETGIYDGATGKVKWGIFFDHCPTYFTYTATPPANAAGQQTFAGTLSVDGNNSTVTGQGGLPHS